MLQALLQILAPDDCLECGQEGLPWCEWCRLGHEPLPSRCYRCHAMTDNYATCKACKRQTEIKRLYVAAEYNGVAKQAIKGLKFGCKRQMAPSIARYIAEIIPMLRQDTVVTSVPTSPVRVRQRGFDHTELIAKEIARIKGLKYESLLVKTNNSRQVGSAREARQTQVKGTIRVKSGKHINGQVLLVDDVITTGATLTECIRMLRDSGARQVDCATFAYSK